MNTQTKSTESMTRKQLCQLYGISRPTLKKWLAAAKIKLPRANVINPKQVSKIIEAFGEV